MENVEIYSQQHYEDLLISFLKTKPSTTIEEYLDFLELRNVDRNSQQIVRNIISNRFNSTSPFQQGILSYDENTGVIRKITH